MSETLNELLMCGWRLFGFKVSQTLIELLFCRQCVVVFVTGNPCGTQNAGHKLLLNAYLTLSFDSWIKCLSTAKELLCYCYGELLINSHFAATLICLLSLDSCSTPVSLLTSIKLILELLKWPFLTRFTVTLKTTASKIPKLGNASHPWLLWSSSLGVW